MSTIAQLEASRYGAAPFELYRFARGTEEWRYATTEDPFVYLGQTFSPAVIRRGELAAVDEQGTRQLEVTLPRAEPLVVQFIGGLTPSPVSLTVYRSHRGASDVQTLFIGQVSALTLEGAEAKLLCTPVQALFTRTVPRVAIQRTCPWMLYDVNCGLAALAFTFAASVTAVNGLLVTVAGAPNLGAGSSYYVAGVLTLGEARAFIVGQNAAVLQLMAPLTGLASGAAVQLVAGCDRTAATCQGRFGNIANFGGFPALPKRNPFDRLT